jgi:hypothetical protein
MKRRFILVTGVVVLLVTAGTLRWQIHQTTSAARLKDSEQMLADLPHLERTEEFVSSNRCRSCHPGEYHTWHRSFHRTMTQVASPENVVGAFDGSKVLSRGISFQVYRDDNQFWAEMPDPEQMMYVVQGGKQIDPMTYWIKRSQDSPVEKTDLRDIERVHRRVVMTTGSHHYQTYWVGDEDRFGNLLQTLPLIYLIKDKRWIPREAAFMDPPGAGRMITQWNHHCIRCHATGGNPAIDRSTSQFDTSVGELGIACESCHGPGEEHIRAYQNPITRYSQHLFGEQDVSIVNPANLDHRASSQVCGQCHGVFITRNEFAMKYAEQGTLYRPGDDLNETRYYIQHPAKSGVAKHQQDLKLNRNFFRERWWDDGTVLAGGREYTAMSVSGCYTRGTISCLSCHTMHGDDPVDQLSPDMRGNLACTQCHSEPRYTTKVSEHTFHSPQSTGSDCMNCHMPHTTYALLGAIRNHGIEVPNVQSSIRHGVPNACNLCHLDTTLQWSQDWMAEWYGTRKQPLTEEQQTVSAALLWLLKGHAAQRVIAAWHFGWGPSKEVSGDDWLAPFQAQLLADPYGVVRYVAYDGLKRLPNFKDFHYDFLGSADELRAAIQRAQQQWQQGRPDQLSRTSDAILVESSGDVQRDRVRQLLEQRDERPVTIKE